MIAATVAPLNTGLRVFSGRLPLCRSISGNITGKRIRRRTLRQRRPLQPYQRLGRLACP